MADPARHDLWLVRHGATEWSEAGRHTSITDLPLLPEGEDVARGLRDRLGAELPDPALVLSSPRQRARRTAELAGFPDPEVDDDLVEWTYGEVEGITTADVRERVPGWSVWSHATPGGETAAQVGERADRVIARVRAADGPSLVFGHGHALRVLTARWLDLAPTEGRHFVLGTATVSVLGWERETPAIRRWNS